MEDIDIKNFTRVSSVTDEDSVLLSRGVSSATHGQISLPLFRKSVAKGITPSIVDGVWYIGDKDTGIVAQGKDGAPGKDGVPGKDGSTPVFYTGTVTTGLPGTEVSAQVRYYGTDSGGAPRYLIDLTIPAGKPGQDGNGAGNVYVTPDTLEAGKLYLFQPGDNGSANGTMVEFENQGGVGQQYPGYPGAEIFNDYTNNIAAGKNAHAEGQETNATGPRAHAEGYKTTVYAADAHAEGRNTWAMGAQSHVEGMYGISWGALSHIEGNAYSEQEEGRVNPAMLYSPEDDNDFLRRFMLESHCFLGYDEEGSEGTYYVVDIESLLAKYYMHASFGERNHVEGCNNICFTNGCHIEGDSNICGRHVTAHGAYKSNSVNHIEGISNDIVTKDYHHNVIATHVEGGYNTVTAETAYVRYSHVGGYQSSVVDCDYAFAHGYGISVSNDYETAFGRYNLSEQDGKKVLFAYGIGTSDSNRANAFAVLEDGTVVIPKMAGGNTSEIVSEQLAPVYDRIIAISNKVTNMYNELTAIISKQQAQIDSLTSLITQLHPGLKVFVVGDRLVITSLMDADVSGRQLNISDADTKVTGDVLVFGKYVPEPEPPSEDAKAYVYLNTLYFTDLIDASVDGSTLSISDTETTVTNGVLTIK